MLVFAKVEYRLNLTSLLPCGLKPMKSSLVLCVALFQTLVFNVCRADNVRVDMGDFKIDQTEVTIGRFAEYADRKQIKTAA